MIDITYLTPAMQEALDAYWTARTPEAQRDAYQRARELGLPASYNERGMTIIYRPPPWSKPRLTFREGKWWCRFRYSTGCGDTMREAWDDMWLLFGQALSPGRPIEPRKVRQG